ncbi:hypothetical protein HN51_019324 [Arachis hypogaea]|uniref:Protein BIC2 n=2 Tax=Arachis TaxID=3817 RepID=A0A6P4BD65_ARADU|nr:protein BIC2 [Arachis duranensis]XP_025614224.1 protein BIC2 [Arachis hypogaea]XP_052109278.1 protein BIC2-like [Arachis duranensis]QHO31067.1 uncharacterized protein DS421_8g238410 [Arachis hypogaea]RYR43076.1 hypothetical protein Ahy_A08g039505 [Arachis hypogaea]
MEENKKLSHHMPTWNTTRNPTTSQIVLPPPNNYDKIISTTRRASRSPNYDEDDEEDEDEEEREETGRERLKRHREEVKGRVKIPEDWGQEKMMKEWIDYTTFDALFAPHTMIVTARDALIADARKTTSSSSSTPPRSSQRLRIYSQ